MKKTLSQQLPGKETWSKPVLEVLDFFKTHGGFMPIDRETAGVENGMYLTVS